MVLIAPLITAPYIARVLGAEGVGVYSYTNSIVSFFSLFAMLGTATYGERTIAQYRESRKQRSQLFWEIEILSLICMTGCVILWFVFISFDSQYRLLFLILTLEIVSSGFDISWFYRGMEMFSSIVVRNALIKAISIAMLFIFVNTRNDVWIYLLILSGTKLISNLSMWMILGKYVERVPFKDIKPGRHFKETVAYFIPTITASVYTYLDKIMIGALTGSSAENGYYEQAQKIIHTAYTIIASLNMVMMSRMSYLFALKQYDEIKQKLEKSLSFILFIGIPIALGIAAVSFKFVPWFYGEGFDKVILLLILSCPLVVILGLHNYLSSQYLIPSGQRVRSTKGVIIGAAVNFFLNLLLIPQLKSIGALIASVIAESTICVVYFYMSKDFIPVRLLLKYSVKPIAGGLIMAITICLFGREKPAEVWVTFIQIVLGVIVYCLIMLLLRDRVFLTLLKKITQRFKRVRRHKDP